MYTFNTKIIVHHDGRQSQWELVSLEAEKNVVKYSCCVDPFFDITFTLSGDTLQVSRRPFFYVQNLTIPCILLALLTVLLFCLPPDSCERIALVITTMLGLTVYMLTFTENVPHTSDVVLLHEQILFDSATGSGSLQPSGHFVHSKNLPL